MTALVRYRNRVFKVLGEQNFILEKKDKQIIEKRTSNGRRYFYMVAKRKEKDKTIDLRVLHSQTAKKRTKKFDLTL